MASVRSEGPLVNQQSTCSSFHTHVCMYRKAVKDIDVFVLPGGITIGRKIWALFQPDDVPPLSQRCWGTDLYPPSLSGTEPSPTGHVCKLNVGCFFFFLLSDVHASQFIMYRDALLRKRITLGWYDYTGAGFLRETDLESFVQVAGMLSTMVLFVFWSIDC